MFQQNSLIPSVSFQSQAMTAIRGNLDIHRSWWCTLKLWINRHYAWSLFSLEWCCHSNQWIWTPCTRFCVRNKTKGRLVWLSSCNESYLFGEIKRCFILWCDIARTLIRKSNPAISPPTHTYQYSHAHTYLSMYRDDFAVFRNFWYSPINVHEMSINILQGRSDLTIDVART